MVVARGRDGEGLRLMASARDELDRAGRVTLVAAAWACMPGPLSRLERWPELEEVVPDSTGAPVRRRRRGRLRPQFEVHRSRQ